MLETSFATIQSRRLEIAAELASLQAEDSELAIAQRVLERILNSPQPSPIKMASPCQPETPKRGRKPTVGNKSQKELVLEALSAAKSVWLDANGIVTSVHRTHGITVPKKSLSPLLSYLKREGRIVRKGRVVALDERSRTPEANRHAKYAA